LGNKKVLIEKKQKQGQKKQTKQIKTRIPLILETKKGKMEMITSIINSLLMLVKKPKVFLPALVFLLIDFGFKYIFEEQMIETIFKFLEFTTYPIFNLQRLPFQFIASYPGDILFLGFALIVSSVIGLMISVSIANFIFEKKSISFSVIYSIKNLGKIIEFTLFFGLILLFSLIVLWIVFFFALSTGIIGTIILLVVIVLMGFVFLHFAFVPALLGKNMKIKEALKESWNFTGKHFIDLILLLIGIMIINFVLSQIYLQILITELGDNELMIFVELIFSLIIISYTNIVFPLFYLNKTNK